MPESPEEFYARIHSQEPLPAPGVSSWEIFPWEVRDGEIVPRPLTPPAPERSRTGVEGCHGCTPGDPAPLIWSNGTWQVKALPPSGLPLALMLESVEHLDLPELDDIQAAAWGQWTVRLMRIVESLPHIGRCHVERWGDGAEHLHTWFFGRPEGIVSTLGSYSAEWDAILPPGPGDVRAADLAEIARKLANHEGTALV